VAWAAVVAGVLVLGFAGVIATSAYLEIVREEGGDDSLAPLGLIIAAIIASPAAVALGLLGLSFVRGWTPVARRTLILLGAAILAIEVLVIVSRFASYA
jgi:hypothetical protein